MSVFDVEKGKIRTPITHLIHNVLTCSPAYTSMSQFQPPWVHSMSSKALLEVDHCSLKSGDSCHTRQIGEQTRWKTNNHSSVINSQDNLMNAKLLTLGYSGADTVCTPTRLMPTLGQLSANANMIQETLQARWIQWTHWSGNVSSCWLPRALIAQRSKEGCRLLMTWWMNAFGLIHPNIIIGQHHKFA